MRRIILIGIFIAFYSSSNELAINYNQELAIKQVQLPIDFNEDKLLGNDALFNDRFIDTSTFLPSIRKPENERIIGPRPIIGIVNKMPNTVFRRDLLAALSSDVLMDSSNCFAKGKVLNNQFDAGGMCVNGSCILDEPINSEMVNLASNFDTACGANIEFQQGDSRLESTVALFLSGKFNCMGYLKDNLLLTARHCFYRNGYVINSLRNKTLEITNDNGSSIRVPVEIQYASLQNVHHKQTLRILLPDDTFFDKYSDVIAISLDNTSDGKLRFSKPEEIARSNMIVVNRLLVPSQSDLEKTIREYDKPSCRIIAASDECILHTCPTLPSISGSPLYQKASNGENEIVGIHVGAYDEASPESCNTVNARFSFGFNNYRDTNINIALPIGEKTKVQKVRAKRI